jgi:HD domain
MEDASPTLLDALAFAVEAHGAVRQARKGTSFPYVVQPIRVAEILYSFGLDEEVVIAGLLHDTTEDAGVTLDQLEARFGTRVAEAVAGASEPDKTASWRERKEHTIRYLRDTANPDVLAVAAADKLDNVRSLRETLLRRGEETWAAFNAGRAEQRWYYRSIAETIRARDPGNLLFRTLDAESRILFHEGEIGTREQQRWMVDGNTYNVLILLHPLEREKLGQRELSFQLDTREPWIRAHYGSNAAEIGATLTARHPKTPVVVTNTDGSGDIFRGGYVMEVGENAGGDDRADDWPPAWFVHACAAGGVDGQLEDILRDLLPPGWGYEIDRRLDFTLTCPHGHTIEPDADCPDGCRNPLTEWCEAQIRNGEKGT